jgi:Helicase HerA, central domain
MEVFFRQFLSVIVFMFALAFSLWAFFALLQRHWLDFLIAAPLASGADLAVWSLFTLALERSSVNPELVQLKIRSAAYDVSLRLVAFAPSSERARELLHQLAMAYRQYDLSSGNALVARWALFDPQELDVDRPSWWDEFRGAVNRLNVAELAGLWHLPLDRDVPLVERTLAKRLLPLPQTVREGMLVGYSEHQGRTVPVHLDSVALRQHIFMVAKTQRGKSTLMAHFAVEAMRQAERTALVVIDPHGDLVRSLLPLVPRERVSDVIYVDFSDTKQVIGLNLLDMRQGRDADKIASNIVHVGELLWSDFWGPRMEDALRWALRTLLATNAKLAQRGEHQFTLLDIPPLFELENFRHRLLEEFVTDADILQWWRAYYERLYETLRIDVINPVLTKIHRFLAQAIVRAVVGQSSSSINFRDILDQRKILLVNTATGTIGPDAAGLLGAVIVDHINFAVREQTKVANPQDRARAVVVIDEFQTILGVDYPGLLAELEKMGASFILATQALGQLKALSEKLHASIFANIGSLFVFQCSAEDADFLCHELDEAVTPSDVINLDDYACYLKTQREHQRLPTMYLQTRPLESGLPEITERILRAMPGYVHPISMAFAEHDTLQMQWYGRELELLRKATAKRQKDSKQGEGADDSKQTQKGKPSREPNSSSPRDEPKSSPPRDEPKAGNSDATHATNEHGDENPKPPGGRPIDEEGHESDDKPKPGQPPTANP